MSRVDVHSHFVPPVWREACLAADLGRPLPPWNEEDHLEWMDKAGISKTILSITDPGTHLVPGEDVKARNLARKCNEFAAELKDKKPDRFGFWATLPMPDVEGSLQEIAYALDNLHADGICMLTNHHGTYLGDTKFEPIFQELNRRGATIFVHPTLPCADNHAVEQVRFDVSSQASLTPVMEFFFDETRTVVSLLFAGIMHRFTKIKVILTHAGGVLPPLVERLIGISNMLSIGGENMSSSVVRDAFRHRFFYDLSGFVFPDQIHGLLRLTETSQILYGSDYPFTSEKLALQLVARLNMESPKMFESASTITAINEGNAQMLLQQRQQSELPS